MPSLVYLLDEKFKIWYRIPGFEPRYFSPLLSDFNFDYTVGKVFEVPFRKYKLSCDTLMFVYRNCQVCFTYLTKSSKFDTGYPDSNPGISVVYYPSLILIAQLERPLKYLLEYIN